MSEIDLALSDSARWLIALADDGPNLTLNAHKKAVHEAQELAERPSLEELADVAICLVGVAVRHGWTADDIAHAVRQKNGVNSRRRWFQLKDGTWQHIPGSDQ